MSKFQIWLNQGMTPAQIMLKWNAGGAKECSRGVNDYGAEYDSCEYVQVTMGYYNKF